MTKFETRFNCYQYRTLTGENDETYKINYGTGYRSNMTINLLNFLPCSVHDFKILLGAVSGTADPEKDARILYDYIADRVNSIKAAREKINERDTQDRAAANADIKKFDQLTAELVKRYNFEPATDADADIKLKAATVYALIIKDARIGISVENSYIKEFTGWTFEKGGYQFDVYKKAPGSYYVLFHGCGVSVTTCKNKNSAPTAITQAILEKLGEKDTQKNIKAWSDIYAAHMNAAGKDKNENKKSEKKTNKNSKNENKKSEKKTNKNKTNQEEKTMKKNENKTTEIRYFDNVKNLEELRTVYKDLLKANHPDNGGDTATMQEINRQYDERREYLKSHAKIENEKDAAKWSDVEDAAIREALYKVVHLKNINIEIVGCWIWIDGDTFTNKQALREAGYKWSNNRKKWHFAPYEKKYYKGGHESFDSLRRKYGSVNVESEEQEAIAQ